MGEGPDVIRRVGALRVAGVRRREAARHTEHSGGAARQLARAGARWVTVHGAGGSEMVEAAVAGLAADPMGSRGVGGDSPHFPGRDPAPGDGSRSQPGGPGGGDHRLGSSRPGAEGVVCSILEAGKAKETAPPQRWSLLGSAPPMRPRRSEAGRDLDRGARRPGPTWWSWGGRSPRPQMLSRPRRALAIEAGQQVAPPSERTERRKPATGGF